MMNSPSQAQRQAINPAEMAKPIPPALPMFGQANGAKPKAKAKPTTPSFLSPDMIPDQGQLARPSLLGGM